MKLLLYNLCFPCQFQVHTFTVFSCSPAVSPWHLITSAKSQENLCWNSRPPSCLALRTLHLAPASVTAGYLRAPQQPDAPQLNSPNISDITLPDRRQLHLGCPKVACGDPAVWRRPPDGPELDPAWIQSIRTLRWPTPFPAPGGPARDPPAWRRPSSLDCCTRRPRLRWLCVWSGRPCR